MKPMKKKFLSILLAAVMVISLIPAISFSASAESEAISITGSFTSYKGWLKANDGQTRYKQRSYANSLRSGYEIDKAYDGDADTLANSYGVGNYYPELYLDGSGNLVRDNTYDNVNVDVVLADYLASGKGKYYGVFKFTLEKATYLDTVTILGSYNESTEVVTANRAFDILYSTDGTTWTVGKSYTEMATASNWSSASGTTATLNIPMYSARAQYLAVAVKTAASDGNVKLHEISVTGTDEVVIPSLVEVATEAELRTALTNYGSSTTTTIKLTSDLIMTGGNVGSIAGTFDGQNHTIYNLQDNSFISPLAGATVKNFTISNMTASDGEEMDNLTGRFSVLTWELPGGTSENPTRIINVHNQRSTKNIDNYCGTFTYRVNNGGYVVFEDCSNSGNYSTQSGKNAKVGGFIGTLTGHVTFTNCTNSGAITSSAAGGFIGAYSGATTITMTGCKNTGVITGVIDGSGYGIAGGLLGGVSNGGAVSGATTVTLTNCSNCGNISVSNPGETSKTGYGVGGLIGHAGGSADNYACMVTLTNCGVYGCTIDASAGTSYAAPLIGKCSPGSRTNYTVTANSCYVNQVDVIANTARKLIGVGSAEANTYPNAYNCVMNGVTEDGSEKWNSSKFSNLSVAVSSTNYFADTDTENVISDGLTPACQQATATADSTKVRFLATLKNINLNDYSKVGFFVTASYGDPATVKAWNLNGTTVYTSVLSAGQEKSANAIYDGHSSEAYIFAMTLEDIDIPEQNVTFHVTPYVVQADGSILFGRTGEANLSVGKTPISIMSYNLKDGEYNNKMAYSTLSYNSRLSSLASNIASKTPDLVMVSESSKGSNGASCARLVDALGSSTYGYVQTDANSYSCGILYRKSLFTVIASGEADMNCYDEQWDSHRGIVYAVLQRTDGISFLAISMHGSVSNMSYTTNVCDWANENYPGYRVVMAGDTNADHTRWVNTGKMLNEYSEYTNANTDYENIVKANNKLWPTGTSLATAGLEATYPNGESIIDWCFFKGFNGSNYEVVDVGTSASDHLPIYVELTLK